MTTNKATDTTPSRKNRFSLLRATIVAAVLGVAVTAYFWSQRAKHLEEAEAASQWATKALIRMAAEPMQNRLDAKFRDADGDLVADPPEDPASRIDPQVLAFSYVAGEDTGVPRDSWKALIEALGKATGRQVEYRPYETTKDQLQALADHQLHIAAFNTGAVAAAVNRCGFVPVCTLGKADGSFGYTSQIIVPKDSPLKRVEDLRGHQLMFTDPMSNSGFKAPLLLLVKDYGLRPDADYTYGFSTSHGESIRRVAEGYTQAACVASDVIDIFANQEGFDRSQVRVIYDSGRFPPACFGYSHALADKPAEAVRSVLAGYAFAGTPLAEEFKPAGVTQLVAVNYKDAWSTVRLIDEFVGHVHETR